VKRLWWILLAVILLCVGSYLILAVAVNSAWPTHEELDEESRRLAGEGAVDCGNHSGFYGEYPLPSDRCAVAALEAGEAFRIHSAFGGSFDAYYLWIAGTPGGEIYFIYAFRGDVSPLIAETCRCPGAKIVTIGGKQTVECPSRPDWWVTGFRKHGGRAR
jgi:hypothetical protein